MVGRSSFSLLSLPVVAVLLAALALGLIFLGRTYGLGVVTFALLSVPIALAVLYLAWYRTLPYEPPVRSPRAEVLDEEGEAPVDEPFDDPVEEADRFESGIDDHDAAEEPRADAPEESELDAAPAVPAATNVRRPPA